MTRIRITAHDRDGWPPLLDRLAERFTVHAPCHPGVRGSEGVEALDDVVDQPRSGPAARLPSGTRGRIGTSPDPPRPRG